MIRAQYYEVWAPGESDREWELVKAYLHLYLRGPTPEIRTELLALHSDPQENHKYKSGPHLHVSCAADPMHKCHFALNLDRLTDIKSNIREFDSTVSGTISMLADEVLSIY